ncbi:MAG: hypothetical protein R2838_09410 [Caldilineaceae bacterium]
MGLAVWRRRSSCHREKIDKFGGPEAYNHYAVGWAHAMDTPYQWTKQVASHWGGTRNGAIVHWPKGHPNPRRVAHAVPSRHRRGAHSLEAAGLPEPIFVNGIQQKPYEGVSMAYSFDDSQAAERHETQYFEMIGNRGIYHKGWTAVTKHRTPWETGAIQTIPFDDDVWGTLRHQHRLDPDPRPRQGAAGQVARTSASVVDRGHQVQRVALGRPPFRTLQPGHCRTVHNSCVRAPAVALRRDEGPLSVVARQRLQQVLCHHCGSGGPGRRGPGRRVAQVQVRTALSSPGAASPGGISLYVKAGKLKYCYNFCGVHHYMVEGAQTFRPAPTRCAWSSPMTAAAWPKAARPHSSSTVSRSAQAVWR